MSVLVVDKNNQPLDETAGGGYSLSANIEYKVTLTATGTAKKFGGYCIVEGGDIPLYTNALLPDQTLTFFFIPQKDGLYTFTAVWGKYGSTADISDSEIINFANR